jgi:hypothetical protein
MNSKLNILHQKRDPLNLGSLPLVEPPADDWPAIETALRSQQGRRRLWKVAGGALAVAASIAVAATLVLNPAAIRPVNQPALARSDTTQAPGQAMVQAEEQAGTKAASEDIVTSLISLSQRLETSLRHIRSEVGVMPTAALIYQVELEDLVAQVDEELSMNPDSTSLWSQRVNLLLDLTQLYKNELRRESHRMASL